MAITLTETEREEWRKRRHTIHQPKERKYDLHAKITCSESDNCPVTWSIKCFTRSVGVLQKTLLIQVSGEHNHEGQRDSAALFTPEAAAKARHFLEVTKEHKTLAPLLRAFLLKEGIPRTSFPSDDGAINCEARVQDGHNGRKVDYIKVFYNHQLVFEKQNQFC